MNIKEKKDRRIEFFSAIAELPQSVYNSKEEFITDVANNAKLVTLLENYSRRDIYLLLFDRIPEEAWTIEQIAILNTAIDFSTLYDFLTSEEMSSIGELIYAKTFAIAGINIFIHVPKTAGSSVNAILGKTKVVLTKKYDTNFIQLALLYSFGLTDSSIYLSGHRPLNLYERVINLTNINSIFTVIRDPIDLAISYFNFAFTMKDTNDEDWGDSYTQLVSEWEKNTASIEEVFLRYTESIFFNEQVKFIYEDYYGYSKQEKNSSKGIIDNLARLGVVIIKPEKLNNYLGINQKKKEVRENASKQYITRSSLEFGMLHHLRNKMIGSVEFYALLDNFDSWRNDGIVDFQKYKGIK